MNCHRGCVLSATMQFLLVMFPDPSSDKLSDEMQIRSVPQSSISIEELLELISHCNNIKIQILVGVMVDPLGNNVEQIQNWLSYPESKYENVKAGIQGMYAWPIDWSSFWFGGIAY